MIELHCCDCMDYMATQPDKAFDLAIVDPPFGIGMSKSAPCERLAKYGSVSQADENPPSEEYFEELERVSANRIVWGGNYFAMPRTRCFLIWDKRQPEGVSFASCEYAWTSFNKSAKTFYQRPQDADFVRIHPMQKPMRLYQWLLTNYAKPGQRILDTHAGSCSSAIAAHYFGVDFVGCEIDEHYFQAAKARIDAETRQIAMF